MKNFGELKWSTNKKVIGVSVHPPKINTECRVG